MKFKNKIKDKIDKMKNQGIDKIEPKEEEPERNPLDEMNEEVEEQSENVEEQTKEQTDKQIRQIPIPVFLTQADLNKMIYETNLLVKDIYNSLKEERK